MNPYTVIEYISDGAKVIEMYFNSKENTADYKYAKLVCSN